MTDRNFISLKFLSAIIKLFITVAVIILYIHYFFPQSWGFYTIEPKQPLYNIYRIHNGIVDKRQLIRNNMSYGMGVSWKGKILYNELYKIVGNKDLNWKVLNEDSVDYITRHSKFMTINGDNEYKNYRGRFLITKTSRPSYLNLKTGGKFYFPKQYILADIR